MDTLTAPDTVGAQPDSAPADPPAASLARRLHDRRTAAAMSQRALARASGVAQSLISQLESGAQTNAELSTIEALALALDCRPADLLGWTEPDAPAPAGVTTIPHDRIRRSDLNPRTRFDPQGLEDLAASIREQGLLQPLVVRADPATAGGWLVVAGERRWRAIGLLVARGERPADHPVPALVTEADDAQHRITAIIENLQREDVAPLDEARAFRALVLESGWTAEAIGKAIGKTARHVQLRLALLHRLHADVQRLLDDGEISLAIARALTTAPMAVQTQVLALMDSPAYGLRTAEDLADYIRRHMHPASRAVFDLALYDGEQAEDPVTGERLLLDGPQFVRLQTEAVDARAEALRARWSWVEVKRGGMWEPGSSDGIVPAAEVAPVFADDPRGAVLHLDDQLALREFTDLVKLRAGTPAGRPPPAAWSPDDIDDDADGTGEAAGAAAPPPPVDPVEAVGQERRGAALRMKTRALQAAVQASPGAWKHQLALSLMGCRDLCDVLAPPPLPQNAEVAPEVMAALARFRDRLGGDAVFLPLEPGWPYLTLGRPDDDGYTGGVTDAAVALLPRLQAMPGDELDDLLAALVASRCATRTLPARPNLGDNPLVLATAGSLIGETPPAFTEEYLATLDHAALRRLARQAGMEDDAFGVLNRSDKAKTLARFLAANAVRIPGPPETRFAGRLDIEEALRAGDGEDRP